MCVHTVRARAVGALEQSTVSSPLHEGRSQERRTRKLLHPGPLFPQSLRPPPGPAAFSSPNNRWSLLTSQVQAHWVLSTTGDKRLSQVSRAQPCPGPSMGMCDVASDGLPWQDPAGAQARPAKGPALPSSDPKPPQGTVPDARLELSLARTVQQPGPGQLASTPCLPASLWAGGVQGYSL